MKYKRISHEMVSDLILSASKSPRRRQHLNIHESYSDKVQKLLNAIGVNSYIRPHRHGIDPKLELLVGVRGGLALVLFDDDGCITDISRFGCNTSEYDDIAVEVHPESWHTVVAITDDAVVLEIKPGPFNPNLAKEWAPWAPTEGSPEAAQYFAALVRKIKLA